MRRFLVPCAAALLAAVGCGPTGGKNPGDPPSGANLSGRVTYKTAAVGGGTVRVVSSADPSKTAVGSIDTSGNYTVKNAPLGPVRIAVETDTARQFDPTAKGAPKGAAPSGPGVPTMKYVPIPPAYKNPETSGLTHTVVAGDQTHYLVLR